MRGIEKANPVDTGRESKWEGINLNVGDRGQTMKNQGTKGQDFYSGIYFR
jgi:hypothetical protein